MSDLADFVVDRVRALLRQEPRFASVRRTDLDAYLGDLERDIRHELEGWAAGVERLAYEEMRAELDELAAEMKQKRRGHHADH
jgi:hypothetical protein